MSQWTHVAGVIRYDALRLSADDIPRIGNAVQFDDPQEKWDACDIPKGSEGSLWFRVEPNPDPCCIQAYTATIEGDLRDYDDNAEIVAWFNKLALEAKPEKGYWIRQGCFTVEVEGQSILTYHYDPETKLFV